LLAGGGARGSGGAFLLKRNLFIVILKRSVQ
jgi:hypothetical protein